MTCSVAHTQATKQEIKFILTSKGSLLPNCTPLDRAHLNYQAPWQRPNVPRYTLDETDLSQEVCQIRPNKSKLPFRLHIAQNLVSLVIYNLPRG